ncbi:MAG: type IX secretion system membrane protein PorP/SprF [Fulvivirga sp.]
MRKEDVVYGMRLTLATMVVVMLSILHEASAQQRVQYTQYMFDGSIINPAYAGADEALSMTFIYRNQWSGVEGAPESQTMSAHTLFKDKQVGVGLIFNHDKIGVHKILNIGSNYAYHLNLSSKKVLSFGLQAGVNNRRADYASLAGQANNDPSISNATISETYFDFGAGLYFRTPQFHLGYSIPEVIPNEITLNDSTTTRLSDLNHFVFSKLMIDISQQIQLTPSVLLKYLNGVPLSYDINLNATYRKVITTGISYRKQESIDFILRLQVTPQFQFGYSYDYPIGDISNLSNASHEIMVRYLFKFKQANVASPR